MKYNTGIIVSALFILISAFPVRAASTYSGNASNAVQWLTQTQNKDGSWGAGDDVKLPTTVEAVLALQALSQRTAAYYWGITWIENHIASNTDYTARRILALSSHGDNLTSDLAILQAAQMVAAPGNSGWGLTNDYQGTALDSAMALLADSQFGVTSNVQSALNYLKGAQLTGTDKGWAVAQETVSDPWTTALVVQALFNYTSLDASLSTNIANGLLSLTTNVSSSSPVQLQALAALTYLRTGNTGNATPLLSSMAAAQSSNGSWSNDPYATALAVRAFAASLGTCLSNKVYMPDASLRAAVNETLGKSIMDALTQCDMAELTTLNASDLGISDLTGMQYAVNLTSADLSKNNITSTTPLNSLPNHPTVNLSNNPGYQAPPMPAGYTQPAQAPALSLPGFIVCALLAVVFMSRRKKGFLRSKTTRNVFMLLMVILLSVQPTGATDKNSGAGKGLKADEVQQIQAISQTVLTAKKNAAPDSDMQILRQQIEALRKAVSELAAPAGQLGSKQLSLMTEEAATAGATYEQEQVKQQERENHVRKVLKEVRRQRSMVQSVRRNEIGEVASMKCAATAKVEELETAVEEVLNSRPEERAGKLTALNKRLAVSHSSQITIPNAGEKTPTISTLVRHREQ